MNLERRDFLRVSIAASAAALADWRLFAASVGLPKYYGAHLAGIAAMAGRMHAEGSISREDIPSFSARRKF